MNVASYDAFLAHNGADKAAVEAIAQRLEDSGLRPWLDAWHILGGESFTTKMGEAMMASGACAFFIGPNGLGKWHREEADLALHRATNDPDFPLIPVLLPGLPPSLEPGTIPPFLQIRTRVDFRSGLDEPAEFRKLVNAISRRPSDHVKPDVQPKKGGPAIMPRTSPPEIYSSDPASLAFLGDNVLVLQQHIRDLAFTPVIGPGCSLIGRHNGPGWEAISARLQALLKVLESEDQPARYLRSLASLRIYEVSLRPRLDAEPVLPGDALGQLQLALARLGALLGTLFASTMLASSMPVWDTPSYKLRIDRNDPNLRMVLVRLLDACVAARRLKSTPEGKDAATGLGAAGLYARLVQFGEQMTEGLDLNMIRDEVDEGRESPAKEDVFDDIRASGQISRHRPDRATSDIELSLHQLEWVADAVWHTLRFDKAAYPRADELAFQISLLTSAVFSPRMELVTAAQLAHVILPQSTIASWFRQYQGVSSPPKMREFYDALAKILCAQFKGYQSHFTPNSGNQTQSLHGFQSVAFSTNFDLEMENALNRSDDLTKFHVLVPVNAYFSDEPLPELEWLFGTVQRGNSVERPDWQWFPKNKEPKPNELKGPIVIRLHGSPLLELPNPEDLRENGALLAEYERFEHATVMSEREYLQNIVWKDPLPDFFNTILLQKNRVLFFLGHFLDEWNTRLRLFSQVRRRNAPASNAKRIAISRSHDPYRSAVLSGIGIHRWIGDLEEVSKAVEGILD